MWEQRRCGSKRNQAQQPPLGQQVLPTGVSDATVRRGRFDVCGLHQHVLPRCTGLNQDAPERVTVVMARSFSPSRPSNGRATVDGSFRLPNAELKPETPPGVQKKDANTSCQSRSRDTLSASRHPLTGSAASRATAEQHVYTLQAMCADGQLAAMEGRVEAQHAQSPRADAKV
eukprot:365535-Chlamydomonas_euryale.AAC.7